jgi:hypothetical protein
MTAVVHPPTSPAGAGDDGTEVVEPVSSESNPIGSAASTTGPAPDASSASRRAQLRTHPLTLLVAATVAAAGAIHFAMAPSHMATSSLEGWGFAVAGWLQIGAAVWLLVRPSKAAALSTAAVSGVAIGLWAVARTVGLPFVPAGHHNSVDLVDGTAVALEAVATLGALSLLGVLRGTSRRAGSPRQPITGALGAAAVAVPIVAATVALLSPSASHHSEVDYGPGYSLLANGHQHDIVDRPYTAAERSEIDALVVATAPLIEKYPTLKDAEAAGYRKAGPFGPGVGQHMNPPNPAAGLNTDGKMDASDMANGMLIYDGYSPDSKLSGFMFLSMSETTPEGFPGTFDHWHSHSDVCLVYGEDGSIDSPFGADTGNVPESLCKKVGGELLAETPYMVHMWSMPGYASSEGLFSELNPNLPCEGGHFYMLPMEKLADLDSACDDSKA